MEIVLVDEEEILQKFLENTIPQNFMKKYKKGFKLKQSYFFSSKPTTSVVK